MSLKCLDLQSAFEACKALNSRESWRSLANASMIAGLHGYADRAFKKTRDAIKAKLDTHPNVTVKEVPDVYPMGWERTLIKEVFHKEYDRLPAEFQYLMVIK